MSIKPPLNGVGGGRERTGIEGKNLDRYIYPRCIPIHNSMSISNFGVYKQNSIVKDTSRNVSHNVNNRILVSYQLGVFWRRFSFHRVRERKTNSFVSILLL